MQSELTTDMLVSESTADELDFELALANLGKRFQEDGVVEAERARRDIGG